MIRSLIAVSSVFLVIAPAQAQENRKPNVIFILADDLGYGELGCYGQKKIKTPHIDALATQGMKFTQFYSGQTVCAPARCSLLTGLHQGHAQIRHNSPHLQGRIQEEVDDGFVGQWPLKEGTFTIGHLFQRQGYKTACVGKWGLGHPQNSGNPNKQGFDLYYGYACQVQAHNYYPTYLYRNDRKEYLDGNKHGFTGKVYAADAMEKVCLDFIRENKDQPFFLYFANPIPHVSLQVPDEDLAAYTKVFGDEKPFTGEGEEYAYMPHTHPRAAYAAMVSHLDRSVGRINALLKELGLEDDTIVIFTSDNGATFVGGYDREFFDGCGGLRGRKGFLYEGGIRVPLIVRWPGKVKAGSNSEHIGAFWDFMPTFAGLTGAKCPQTDGISILPELLGEKQAAHDFLYWEFWGYGGWQVMRQGDWKAVQKDLHAGNTHIELYNLATDPAEQHDVSAQHPQRVKEMKQKMMQQHQENPNFPITILGDARNSYTPEK
ncbi:MAG: arylsulfatase [Akkermansiaceae bacterium]|nr:arylsulfatase [Akkermansiaceae bacterium]